MVEEGIRIDWN